jgi:hypothetical protein
MDKHFDCYSFLTLLSVVGVGCLGDESPESSTTGSLRSDAAVSVQETQPAQVAPVDASGLQTELDASNPQTVVDASRSEPDAALPGRPVEVADEPATRCFGPGRDLELATQADVRGCACEPDSRPVCESDTLGRRVGLVCSQGSWVSVEDGPCAKAPPG